MLLSGSQSKEADGSSARGHAKALREYAVMALCLLWLETVRKTYARILTKLSSHLACSLTYDQGKEISQHKAFTISTGMNVYFAHPASPWERGTNENTNDLIRQYFTKETVFDEITP
jgi:IS30 family transposase